MKSEAVANTVQRHLNCFCMEPAGVRNTTAVVQCWAVLEESAQQFPAGLLQCPSLHRAMQHHGNWLAAVGLEISAQRLLCGVRIRWDELLWYVKPA